MPSVPLKERLGEGRVEQTHGQVGIVENLELAFDIVLMGAEHHYAEEVAVDETR